MSLKKSMFDRIEKDSIKVNVAGEDIYLKRGGFMKDWRVIYPPVDLKSVENATDNNGNIDWSIVKWDRTNFIFGGKGNAVKTLIIAGITTLAAFGVHQIVQSFNAIISNPAVQLCLNNSGIIIG